MSHKNKIFLSFFILAFIFFGIFYFLQETSKIISEQNQKQILEEKKVWNENGISFTYPAKYTADNKGLWTAEEYENHVNPPIECNTCQIPHYEIKVETTDQSLDQYFIAEFDLPGNSLDEATVKTDIPYQSIIIGSNDFIKITISDLYEVVGYFTKHDDRIVSFRVYQPSYDTLELQNILATLKFD